MMSDSGARGNISNFTQLAGMRGLMAALMVESWNCQSFRTSVKDYPSWKCLSQLTGLVKDDRYSLEDCRFRLLDSSSG